MYNLFALEFPEESLINVRYKNTTKIGTLQRGYKNTTVQYLERKIHGHDHNIPYGNHIYIYIDIIRFSMGTLTYIFH
jgi:hypothetical protein